MKKIMMVLTACAVMAGYSNIYAQNNTQVKAAPQKQLQAAEVKQDKVDPTTKGPKGEVVFIGPKGGKYYMAANNRKVYIDSNIDPNMKGPKGQVVYTGPKGGKYYLNDKGEKIFINPDKKTDKQDMDKQGTIKRTETPPPAK